MPQSRAAFFLGTRFGLNALNVCNSVSRGTSEVKDRQRASCAHAPQLHDRTLPAYSELLRGEEFFGGREQLYWCRLGRFHRRLMLTFFRSCHDTEPPQLSRTAMGVFRFDEASFSPRQQSPGRAEVCGFSPVQAPKFSGQFACTLSQYPRPISRAKNSE